MRPAVVRPEIRFIVSGTAWKTAAGRGNARPAGNAYPAAGSGNAESEPAGKAKGGTSGDLLRRKTR